MAFALAISTVRDLNGSEASRAILSVTMGIAAVTVLVIGGTSHAAVEKARGSVAGVFVGGCAGIPAVDGIFESRCCFAVPASPEPL